MNGFRYIDVKDLPPIEKLFENLPLLEADEDFIRQSRKEVKDILSGKDQRLLLIVGPCSAGPEQALTANLHYAKRLKEIEAKVCKALKLVMRVYIQKPRTTKGWEGLVNQPNPFAPPDIERGIYLSRKLMLQIIGLGIPPADEAVFTQNGEWGMQLLAYVAIGARSSEDPEHRNFASIVDCPVGLKNPRSGSMKTAVNSVIAAQNPHTVLYSGRQVRTLGNPYAHLVLRGWENGSNYQKEFLLSASDLLMQSGVRNPAIVVDTSHENSRVNGEKDPFRQIEVAHSVMRDKTKNPKLRNLVKGLALESSGKNGCQNLEELNERTLDREGLSCTDPCLGIEETEELILDLAEMQRKMMN